MFLLQHSYVFISYLNKLQGIKGFPPPNYKVLEVSPSFSLKGFPSFPHWWGKPTLPIWRCSTLPDVDSAWIGSATELAYYIYIYIIYMKIYMQTQIFCNLARRGWSMSAEFSTIIMFIPWKLCAVTDHEPNELLVHLFHVQLWSPDTASAKPKFNRYATAKPNFMIDKKCFFNA